MLRARLRLALRPELDKFTKVFAIAYIIFTCYVATLVFYEQAISPLTWLWLWGLSIALMACLGASTFTHEHQWGIILAGFVGVTGVVSGTLLQIPILKSLAGFTLSTAYWLGVRRHIGKPYVNLEVAAAKAISLNLALLVMNVVAYLLVGTS